MKALHGQDSLTHGQQKESPQHSADVHVEGGLNVTEDGDLEHPEMKLRSLLEHFSVYALDADEGHIGR